MTQWKRQEQKPPATDWQECCRLLSMLAWPKYSFAHYKQWGRASCQQVNSRHSLRDFMNWLTVERLQNWNADLRTGFAAFGIPKRKLRLASQIAPGDRLITYVSSGVSKFSDIREAVRTAPVLRDNVQPNYDELYPTLIYTKPIVILPRENWVDIHPFLPKLSFTKGKKNWRNIFLHTLLPLTDADAKIIFEAIETAGLAAS